MTTKAETHINLSIEEITTIELAASIINELVDHIDGDEVAQINGEEYDYNFIDQVCVFLTDLKQHKYNDIVIKTYQS